VRQLTPGVWRLDEFPRPLFNVYLAEDVLVEPQQSARRGVT